ncbi:MAG: recombinase family protein, partial [Planctomycetota bacterium]
MVERGEVIFDVPVGYVRTSDNRYEMTADLQVQQALHGLFAKFRELGSARQVVLWYCQEKIPLPRLERGESGWELSWSLPTYASVIKVLHNPVYAGTYVHGRRCTKTRLVDGRARKTSGHELPESEW